MSRYTDYKAIQQPETYRSWPDALRRQRLQIGILAVVFFIGAVLLAASAFVGGLLMLASGVSLGGTIVGGRYFS